MGVTGLKWIAVLVAMMLLALVSGCVAVDAATVETNGTTPALTAINLVDAVDAALPSVVRIEVRYGPQGSPGDPSAQAGAGSGWVVDSGGIIVTNNHVINGAETIEVVFQDGAAYTATDIATAADRDLAVIRIDAGNLNASEVGDSAAIRLGQPVAAIGNALALGVRVTSGIISRLDVDITERTGEQLSGMVETDALINPGNSGGILINGSGEVIGVVTAGLQGATGMDVEGFGYAIPSNDAMPVIRDLISQLP